MKPSELRGKQPDELNKELESLLRDKLGEKAYSAFQAAGVEHWLGN